ncbi:MAG: hypothetical protein ABIH41_04190 [Nanoarchaeota archaeon]
MATLGEAVGTTLGNFSFIFVFLISYAIAFGLLSYANPLKDERKGLYGIISFVIAIMVVTSGAATAFVQFFTSWFFILAVGAFMIMFVFGVFGLKGSDWPGIIRNDQVYIWVIIFSIVIVLFAFGSVFGQKLLDVGSGGGQTVTGSPMIDADGNPVLDSGGNVVMVPQQTASVAASNSFTDNVLKTFIHPKVLGILLIFMIGFFTILFMTKS